MAIISTHKIHHPNQAWNDLLEWIFYSLFLNIHLIMYLSVFLHVYLLPMEVRRVLGLLKVELRMVVNNYVCAENQTQVLQSNKCS